MSSQLLGRALLEADMAEGLDDDMARGPYDDVAEGHSEVIWGAVSLGSGHPLRLWRFVFRSLALDFLALGFNNFIKARCCRNSNSSCLNGSLLMGLLSSTARMQSPTTLQLSSAMPQIQFSFSVSSTIN